MLHNLAMKSSTSISLLAKSLEENLIQQESRKYMVSNSWIYSPIRSHVIEQKAELVGDVFPCLNPRPIWVKEKFAGLCTMAQERKTVERRCRSIRKT